MNISIQHNKSIQFQRRLNTKLACSSNVEASTVPIFILGKHLQVTQSIEDYVRQKVSKSVSKYEGTLTRVGVRLSARGGQLNSTKGPPIQSTEITVITKGHGVIHTEDAESNLYASIDLASDKIERKIRQLKQKDSSSTRKGTTAQAEAQQLENELLAEAQEAEEASA